MYKEYENAIVQAVQQQSEAQQQTKSQAKAIEASNIHKKQKEVNFKDSRE